MKNLRFLALQALLASCSWMMTTDIITVSIELGGRERVLAKVAELPFLDPEEGDGLLLRVETLDGNTVSEAVIVQPPFRLSADLKSGEFYRIIALARVNNGSPLYMDRKTVQIQADTTAIVLRLGHLFESILSEGVWETDLVHENFSADYPDDSDTWTVTRPAIHAPTLRSFQYRINNGPWITATWVNDVTHSSSFPVDYSPGLNFVRIRYFQESDGQPVVYTFRINRI